MANHTINYDVDKDGKVSKRDIQDASEMLEIDLREEKAESQKRMAWASLISMVVFTACLFSPLISDARVNALANLLGLFYVAQAGVVGAYMGVTTWMSNTATRSSYDRYSATRTTRTTPTTSDDNIVVRGRD